MTKWLEDKTQRRAVGAWVACAVIGLGVLLLVLAIVRFLTERRGIGLVAPGATLIAAGLAAFAAIVGIATWAEQHDEDRQRSEYKNRETVYGEIAQNMLSRFPSGGEDVNPYDRNRDRELRASAALWASSDVVKALGSWQTQLTAVMVAHNQKAGSVDMTATERKETKDRFAQSLEAMRMDLASKDAPTVSKDEILASIFNEQDDRQPAAG